MSLFRPEVLAARSGQWLGSVRVGLSLPAWMVGVVALALSLALVVYAIVGTYTKKAHVAGILVSRGGDANAAAPSAGKVALLRVAEGQHVAAGDVLMVIDIDRFTTHAGVTADAATLVGEQIEARRRALQNERALRRSQAELRLQMARDHVAASESETQKLDEEIALQKRRRDLVAGTVKRYEELAASRFVSPNQLQQQQEVLLEQDSRLQALERGKLGLVRDRMTGAAEQRQIEAQLATDLAALERDLAALSQEAMENAARHSAVIAAPRAGTVSAIAVAPGQAVAAGQSLVVIQPDGAPLEAHLYAPSRTVGFVAEGQPVQLRYAAFPYQKFGLQNGTVASVSRSAFAPNELPPAMQALFNRPLAPEALYRVTVSLNSQEVDTYGKAQALKPGMALEADIVQERRRIVEWMFEPLFAFARRA